METSRPFPGTVLGDAGPYSAEQWWDCWLSQSRAGGRLSRVANYDIGVFYAIANALEPTSNVTEITVDTGASLVDGLYHESDASVAVPILASGVGTSRIDVIVVRKNYQQAVTYTPTGGAPTVPPRTARITVIRGAEAAGPVAPSLTQDVTRATYWDIPIAQVQVSDAGALSGFTDLREFVDAEVKVMYVPPLVGKNATDETLINLGDVAWLDPPIVGLTFPDLKNCYGFSRFVVPQDFISGFEISAIVSPYTSGNVYGRARFAYGGCGQYSETHDDDSGALAPTALAGTALTWLNECILPVELTSAVPGDFVICTFQRDSTNILDTIGAKIFLFGWNVSYFGWKK